MKVNFSKPITIYVEPQTVDLNSESIITLHAWVNEIQKVIAERQTFEADPETRAHYQFLAVSEGQIAAIKAYRAEKHVPLKDARDFIDSLMYELKHNEE